MLTVSSQMYLRNRAFSLGGIIRPTQRQIQQAWEEGLTELMTGAWLSQPCGVNWRPERPVQIGCAVLGHDSQADFDCATYGWNYTPVKLTEEQKRRFKPCAEKRGIIRCLERMLMPVGLVVYTNHNQPDDETGLETNVLMPCSNCVAWMETLLPPWFRVGSFRPRLDTDPPSDKWFVYEEYMLDELIGLHQRAFDIQHSRL